MKGWIIPGLLAAVLAGFALGRLTGAKNKPSSETGPSPSPPLPPPSAPPGAAPADPPPKTPTASAAPTGAEKSPKQRVIELLTSYLDADKLYGTLWQAALRDAKLQREIVNLIRGTDDPKLMEACEDLLIAIKDPALMNEIIELFRSDKNMDRRLAWAYVLGANWKNNAVRPMVLDLLDGDDAKLQERMLQRMNIQDLNYEAPDTEIERATARLRMLVRAGANDGLRAASADAMRGVQKEEDVNFLIETLLNDSAPDVQLMAFHSLPCNYQSPSPLLRDQIRAMYVVALDERRDPGLRKRCADRALQNTTNYLEPNPERLLTVQEEATLKAILGKK